MLKAVCFLSVLFSLSGTLLLAEETVYLWDTNVPGALGDKDVDVPMLRLFTPAPENAAGVAVIICPGGSYKRLVMEKEGYEIGRWLQSIGVAAFVLKYRLPTDGYRHPMPLFDAQRAIRLVRFNAEKWGINPAKIGIAGFSAGGHLASSAGIHFNQSVIVKDCKPDAIDAISCRPDFMVLVYPVISMQEEITHIGSRNNLLGESLNSKLIDLLSNEKQITLQTPPTFLVHASDDRVVLPENSIRFYQGLLKAKVPAEMHLYLKGGHGFGMRSNIGSVAQWVTLCEAWMRQTGFLVVGKHLRGL